MNLIFGDQLAIGDLDDRRRLTNRPNSNFSIIIDVRSLFSRDEENFCCGEIDGLVDVITSAIRSGFKVFIHCHAGIDRAPFVGMLVIRKMLGIHYNEAYGIIKKVRPVIIEHYEWVDKMKKSNLSDKTFLTKNRRNEK